MLYAIAGVLVVLWLIGLVSNVVGSLVHALLVIALIVIVFQFISGRRTLR